MVIDVVIVIVVVNAFNALLSAYFCNQIIFTFILFV